MLFLHPEFIYMMLPLLLILFGMLTTQADLKTQIFSAEILAKLRVESDQFSTRTRNLFFLFMFKNLYGIMLYVYYLDYLL